MFATEGESDGERTAAANVPKEGSGSEEEEGSEEDEEEEEEEEEDKAKSVSGHSNVIISCG